MNETVEVVSPVGAEASRYRDCRDTIASFGGAVSRLESPGSTSKDVSPSWTPGMAHVDHEGDLHSPRRDGPTKLIRPAESVGW
jgi:hypothetical protein